MITSAKTTFHWKKVLLEVKTVEVFSYHLAIVCALNIQGKIANLIDDEHTILGQNLELIRQAVLKMSFFNCSMSWWQLM